MSRKVLVEQQLHRSCRTEKAALPSGSECDAGANIVTLKLREISQNLGLIHTGSQVVQHIVDSNTRITDAGFARALGWIDSDAFEKVH